VNSQHEVVVAPYEYRAGEDKNFPSLSWSELLFEDVASVEDSLPTTSPPAEILGPARRTEIDQEMQRKCDEARRQGLEDGRKAEREEQTVHLKAQEHRQREQYGELLLRFEAARDHYLNEIEHEVVALSLAVAARILRREAQMDPLLLSGAVRVALGQLSDTTRTRLHVPPQERDLWSEAIAHIPNLRLRPEVVAEDGLVAGDCRIETESGSVDLGLRAQLGEIENGFLDRKSPKSNHVELPAEFTESPEKAFG